MTHIWAQILKRFFLFVIAVVLPGCSHLSPANAPVAERKADIDAPIVYRCNSGRIVNASYHSGTTAVVEYEGKTREMIIIISGSGARYADGGLEWWTKGMGPGSEGMLLQHKNDGTTGDIIERCVQASTG
ncbi:membrane-bound lysozyme inhibitor of c-type lysozyme MliC [Nitrosospira sp. Nsp5]|uniref:Membrane-bound lysozyme-inhibitor of c-type lysozyme n=1 Tax=Nitrosospira multiformis TaxID=1231 RepID=A0ABY0TJ66_9PROT|nr:MULTISPECIES: MliC family protein [Nitrosospira]PTR05961.1 membrane-bound lysozyme inhibitor of c-type lysozyme MliC [Nitrosospira sp. Nsp5]SDQ92120.1 Membrane-bound lysozyme-inhibitor of c-type lysozyme [Nitrosospira multiformis]